MRQSQASLVTRDQDRLREAVAEGRRLKAVELRLEEGSKACSLVIQVLPRTAQLDNCSTSFLAEVSKACNLT